MEKLTLKELAPYLPYNLMVLNLHTNLTYQLTGRVIDRVADLNESHKPILRNLSDLGKEIEHNGEKFVPIRRMLESNTFDLYKMDEMDEESINSFAEYMIEVQMSYDDAQMLLGWKFDIFNLIDKNLAVPVTENFNPYK